MSEQTMSPLLTKRFEDALVLANDLHRLHQRKSTEVPYMSHLMSVAALVLEDEGDEDEAIAALLHDALEDCPDQISGADIEQRFGARVREIVETCTDTPLDHTGGKKPDWKPRKQQYIDHIRKSGVPNRVSLADKVHNARSILRDHRIHGEAVWDRFTPDRDETLWYYRELAAAYREAGAEGFLIDELDRTIDEVEARSRTEGSGTVERAVEIAARAHAGEVDKSGAPYLLHPLRMMVRMSSDEERITAVLHDVVEDSDWTPDDLRNAGFSEEIVEAVECVSRRPDETYMEFVQRSSENAIARRVKIADLEDNSDLSRISSPTDEDYERLEKYARALQLLQSAEEAAQPSE